MRSIALLAVLLIGGCSLTTQPNKPDDKPVVVVKDAGDYFEALASCVGKTILDSNQLARAVSIGQRNGWLTADQVALFDAAFPKATSAADLTDEDAEKLRGLK